MDISVLINNYSFYEGFEEDREIELFLLESPEFHIHIWEGLFEDILADPPLSGDGWNGFTRDLHQLERTYGQKNTAIDVSEYLSDLYYYKSRDFDMDDTKTCYDLICSFLEFAEKENKTVIVNWIV